METAEKMSGFQLEFSKWWNRLISIQILNNPISVEFNENRLFHDAQNAWGKCSIDEQLQKNS